MDLVTIAHPDRPALDMALTGVLLDAVAHGSAPDTVRVFRPAATLAFGRRDRTRAGFGDACRAALAHGHTPVIRWGGGHAAAYGPDCVVIEIIRAQQHIISSIEKRFLDLAALVQEALRRLGVMVEVGELAGEYCPGRFSLHLPDGPKTAGIAQRVTPGASLTTAAVTVSGSEALRAVIADVYATLDLPVDVSAAGALTDRHPNLTAQAVMDAVVNHARERYRATPAQIDTELVARAAKTVAGVKATSPSASA